MIAIKSNQVCHFTNIFLTNIKIEKGKKKIEFDLVNSMYMYAGSRLSV